MKWRPLMSITLIYEIILRYITCKLTEKLDVWELKMPNIQIKRHTTVAKEKLSAVIFLPLPLQQTSHRLHVRYCTTADQIGLIPMFSVTRAIQLLLEKVMILSLSMSRREL
jgi:hypothetical protein